MNDRIAPPANLPPSPGSQAAAERVDEAERPVAGSESSGSADAAQTLDQRTGDAVEAGVGDHGPAGTPRAGAARAGTTGDGEVEIECPGCGLVLVGESAPRPTAAWFCPRCDYPVFWASPPADDDTGIQRRARRRLPGTGGREALGAAACWHCGEMNDPGITSCLRCAATLPKPVPPEPERVRVDIPVPVPVPHPLPTVTWPFVVAVGLAGAAVAISGTLWVLRLLVGA